MMSRIHRPARIIAPSSDAVDNAGTRRVRRFDYSMLLQRRPNPRAAGKNSKDDANGGEYSTSEPDANEHEDTGNTPTTLEQFSAGDSLAERIGSVSVPIINAVYWQQNRFIGLIARVAREIANFCANDSIIQSGHWEVRLPLDPGVLPDTILYLTLSPLSLQLRFDTQDPSSRQLLLQHSGLLDHELTQLLDAWGEPRQVEISI